jgi:MYXO-CTERM domain-containing protein
VQGDVRGLLAGSVADGRIIDATAPGQPLHVHYLPGRDQTPVVPEPGAVVLLALVGAALLPRRRLARNS